MKFFLNLILSLVLIALGYILYPNIADKLGLDQPEDEPAVAEDAATPTKDEEKKPEEKKDAVVADKKDDKPEPKADPSDSKPPVPRGDQNTPIAKRFPYPKIKSLAAITNDWKEVPGRAYPKSITINKPIQFVVGDSGNTATKPAGSKVVPIGTSKQGNVKVAMSKGSSAHGIIAMDDTDFKEQVRELYKQGVERIYARIDARRAAELKRREVAAAVPDEVKKTAGAIPKSESDEDRYIRIMQASVDEGDLQGIDPTEIIEWRFLGFESVNGQNFWTGAAVYEVHTMFGKFHEEAKALIQNDKVVRWLKAN